MYIWALSVFEIIENSFESKNKFTSYISKLILPFNFFFCSWWLIHFNSTPTQLVLVYAKKLGNRIDDIYFFV